MSGAVDTIFGGGQEKAAQDLADRIRQGMGAAQQYLGPYVSKGPQFLQEYQNALEQAQDPANFLNQLMEKYKLSPAAEQQIDVGTQAANRAAAASGMLGSGALQKEVASQAEAIRGEDLQNFLTRVLGLRGQYLSGIGGLNQLGFRGSEDLARMLMEGYQNLGGAEAEEDVGRAGGIKGLIGTGIGLLNKLPPLPFGSGSYV